MANGDRPLKDILTSETLLLEYYLLKKGLELVIKELENGNGLDIPFELIPKAKGLAEDLLRD